MPFTQTFRLLRMISNRKTVSSPGGGNVTKDGQAGGIRPCFTIHINCRRCLEYYHGGANAQRQTGAKGREIGRGLGTSKDTNLIPAYISREITFVFISRRILSDIPIPMPVRLIRLIGRSPVPSVAAVKPGQSRR